MTTYHYKNELISHYIFDFSIVSVLDSFNKVYLSLREEKPWFLEETILLIGYSV